MKLIGFVAVLVLTVRLANSQSTSDSSIVPDTIVFTAGQLSGVLVGADSKSVVFANKVTGVITIKWEDVQSVSVGGDVALKFKTSCAECPPSGISLKGTTLAVHDRTIRDGLVALTKPVRVEDISSIAAGSAGNTCPGPNFGQAPATSGPPAFSLASNGWHIVKVKVGVAVLGATQKQQTYNAEADMIGNWHVDDCGWPHQRTKLTLIPSYDDKRKNSQPGSANVTRYYAGTLQHLMFLKSNRTYAQGLADLYHNDSLGIYFQQAYGGGVGTTLQNLELDGDLRFIGQHFYSPGRSQALIGAQLSERYYIPLNFIAANASLSETVKVLPVFNQSRAWQAHGIVELTIPFTPKLAFTVSAFDDYVENAPTKFNRNYFKTTIGVQYSPVPKK